MSVRAHGVDDVCGEDVRKRVVFEGERSREIFVLGWGVRAGLGGRGARIGDRWLSGGDV